MRVDLDLVCRVTVWNNTNEVVLITSVTMCFLFESLANVALLVVVLSSVTQPLATGLRHCCYLCVFIDQWGLLGDISYGQRVHSFPESSTPFAVVEWLYWFLSFCTSCLAKHVKTLQVLAAAGSLLFVLSNARGQIQPSCLLFRWQQRGEKNKQKKPRIPTIELVPLLACETIFVVLYLYCSTFLFVLRQLIRFLSGRYLICSFFKESLLEDPNRMRQIRKKSERKKNTRRHKIQYVWSGVNITFFCELLRRVPTRRWCLVHTPHVTLF